MATKHRATANSSLFDHPDIWRENPREALDALLQSQEFGATSRAHSQAGGQSDAGASPTNPRAMAADSVKVYQAMFTRYLRHLAKRGAGIREDGRAPSLLEATDEDVGTFLRGDLARVSAETLWRYVRLLERVHEHLVKRGWREDGVNPVSDWVRNNAIDGSLREMVAARPRAQETTVSPAVVAVLGDWLERVTTQQLDAGHWREARDSVLASLSLGTGLRYAELVKLRRGQLTSADDAAPEQGGFELDVPGWASVDTARPHRVFVTGASARALGAWLRRRWDAGEGIGRAVGDLVFPAGLGGKELSPATMYRNLADLCENAMRSGVLDESSRWVLSTGAQGLRRAHVIAELALGRDPELLTERLGHWRQRSVMKYRPAARMAQTLSAPGSRPRARKSER